MYLIKRIEVDNFNETVKSIDGIEYTIINGLDTVFNISNYFYDIDIKLNLKLENDIESTQIKHQYKLTYANSYDVNKHNPSWTGLVLNVGKKDNKVYGYIIFIDYVYNVKTNGEVICDRESEKLVLVLKEGKYLKFKIADEENIIKVEKGKLLLIKEL